MKFIAVLLLSLFSNILYAACSTAYQHALVNETNTKDNFIEIYVLGTAPSGIYTVKACISDADCSTETYTVNGTSSWYVKNFGLINNRSEFDITLYGPDGNVADYIRIGDPPTTYNTDYQSCSSIDSNLNTSAHTYHRTNSGQRDFYRYPDGSATWQETNWGNDTSDTSNAPSLPQMLYVDDDRQQCPNAAYTTISSAVAAATTGSTIMVCSGTYAESVNLIKDNLTITSQTGNRDDVVVTNSANVFHWNTNNIQATIKNITVESTSGNGVYASSAYNTKNTILDNLKIIATGNAIQINTASTLAIKNSCLYSADDSAIKLGSNTNNITINSNTINSNSATAEALYVGSNYDDTLITNNCLYGDKLLYLKTGGGGILGLLIPPDTTTLSGNYYDGSTANPYTYIRPAHSLLDLLRRFDDLNPKMSCTLPICGPITPPPPECTEFRYDLYHTSDPYRLQTRIASRPFDVNVTVACTGTGEIPARKIVNLYGFSGDCPANTAGLPVLWSGSADINDTSRTITLTGLNSPKAYSNLGLMLETDTGELNCSTDSFAIRPPSFGITSPASPIRAGNITLQLSATDSGGGYNGTAIASTALQTPDPDCPVASGFLSASAVSEPLSLPFSGDMHTSEMNATDIGEISLSVKDTSWTAVDQIGDCIPDSSATVPDAQGRFGCHIDSNLSLKIIPHHFDVNATLSNAGDGFTYLSNDLNMSATLDLRLTAQTEYNATTQNYNTECYAQATDYSVSYSTNPAVSVGNLHYLETNTSRSDINTTATSFVLPDIPKEIFGTAINGSAQLEVKINFERNTGVPVNPFDLNISSVIVTDADNVEGNGTTAQNATFVYGRVRTYDITTNEASAPNPVEFEVYSTTSGGYVGGMPQNVLRWYRNLNHNDFSEGNVTGGNFAAAGLPYDGTIDVSSSPSDGRQTVIATSSTEGKQTVHLDISPWLWYSQTNSYSYSIASSCSQHPCFIYEYTPLPNPVTDQFRGSDFEMAPAKDVTKKGAKFFR